MPLAAELVDRFHGAGAGPRAREAFIARFSRGALPDEIPEIQLTAPDGEIPVANILRDAGLTQSTSESMRMVRQGAVKVDGERLEDPKRMISAGATHIFQVGKRRIAKVTIN